MIDYILAEKLKNAGFPQTCKDAYYRYKLRGWQHEDGIGIFEKEPYEGDYEQYEHLADKPSLSELIEACGDNKPTIRPWNIFEWQASVPHKTLRKITQGVGKTPEEALAKLYIAIHKQP